MLWNSLFFAVFQVAFPERNSGNSRTFASLIRVEWQLLGFVAKPRLAVKCIMGYD